MLVPQLRDVRGGLADVLRVRPGRGGGRAGPGPRPVAGRRGVHVGRVRGRDERASAVVATGERCGRGAVVGRRQRDRGGGQAGGARMPDEAPRRARRAGQRVRPLRLLDDLGSAQQAVSVRSDRGRMVGAATLEIFFFSYNIVIYLSDGRKF